jgi:hypothetical protein
LEKPPRHWPNNLDERHGEPGGWTPPSNPFSRKKALKEIAAPLAASLDPAGRRFGNIPADLHVDGFVPLRLPLSRGDGSGTGATPYELAVVHLGPRQEAVEGMTLDPTIQDFLLLTSRGKVLWKWEIDATPPGAFANRYRLARVVTQFDKAPWVLLFTDSGANTRLYSYHLYRVTESGLDEVWEGDLDDGQTGSLQRWYSRSNFDFSRLRAGRTNEFTVYTTSGIRRLMDPSDVKDAKPKYTKRVYRWNQRGGTFVKVGESSFSKLNPRLDSLLHLPIFRNGK